MKIFNHSVIFIALSITAYCVATVVINVPTCNIDQECGPQGNCNSTCFFQGLNAAQSIITLSPEKNVLQQNFGHITSNTKTAVLFEKKSKQVIIQYQATIGRLKNRQISLLFMIIDLANIHQIENLPQSIRTDIAQYTQATNNQITNARYAFFILKGTRKNIWTKIGQTYLDGSSKDRTNIPLVIQPDGNIHITIPEVQNKQKEENFYIKIEQL